MSKKSRVKFKDYDPNQAMLLPPSLEELISKTHSVRVVSSIIDKVDLDSLIRTYRGGGASSYHPRMMLKVLVYAYLNNVYSSRKIEAALKENTHFMWLSGMRQPDHNTINRFRSDRLQSVMKEVFCQVVLLLVESGHVDMKQVYTDGTKIEANANKYTFVWGKSIQRNKQKMKTQLQELWNYTQSVASQEMDDPDPSDFEELDPDKVEQTIESINQALKNKQVDKKVKQKLNYAKRNWPVNLRKYEQQQALMGQRNSYSKTDPDATFMRMKEDHMKNGQLKPGYNLQWSTQDQFIINYTLHQDTTDTLTLIPHLIEMKAYYGSMVEELVADSGYGSEQNYVYLEDEQIKAYVKYNYFHKEQQISHQQKFPFSQDKLYYDAQKNVYICPMGQPMNYIGDRKQKAKSGYLSTVSRYQALNCEGCPLRGKCHKSRNNRIIEVNHRLNQLRSRARERLNSEQGKLHRSQRPVDVEAAFGNLKQNKGFKRFMLRGIDKVAVETGLLALAINLKKVANQANKALSKALNLWVDYLMGKADCKNQFCLVTLKKS